MPKPSVTMSVNGGAPVDVTRALDNAGVGRFTDRILRLMEEMDETKSAIKDIYEEAKSAGYHVPAMREVVKRLREDSEAKAKRADKEMARDLMLRALGEFVDTPLGQAAAAGAS